MSKPGTAIQLASASLKKLFASRSLPANKNTTYEQILEKLSGLILNLLQNDRERLLHIVYRIDIAEHKFKAALEMPTLEEVAKRLAELVIERELQKVQFRLKYSSSRN